MSAPYRTVEAIQPHSIVYMNDIDHLRASTRRVQRIVQAPRLGCACKLAVQATAGLASRPCEKCVISLYFPGLSGTCSALIHAWPCRSVF